MLHDDISKNIDEWNSFFYPDDLDLENRKKELVQKLDNLKFLIWKNEQHFDENRFFL